MNPSEIQLDGPTKKLLDDKKMVFTSEPILGKDDWFLCELSRASGFVLFKENIPKTGVKDWIKSCIDFTSGSRGWVK